MMKTISWVPKSGKAAGRVCLAAGMLALLGPALLAAQAPAPQLRLGVRADTVFVYHTGITPLGGGILVDRDAGQGWERLTDRPVLAARGPDEFVLLLDELYPQIQQDMERQDPTATFYALRSDPLSANLLTFRYREVALALGRLYIDTGVAAGASVRYRVTLVDGAEVPIGEPIAGSTVATPLVPAPPSDFSAEHSAEYLVLRWRYPTLARGQDDGVTAFRILEGGADGPPLTRQPILRAGNIGEYVYRYDIPAAGQVLDLHLSAVAYTGQASEPVHLRYQLADRFGPRPVGDVRAADLRGTVEIVWTGQAPDRIAGYHIYRAAQQEADFARVTAAALDSDVTVWIDSVPGGGRFFYQVTALDSAGNESAPSTTATVLVVDVVPPSPPASLVPEYLPDRDAVLLRWSDPTPAPDLRTYVLMRRRSDRLDGGAWAQVNIRDTRDLEWVDTGPGERGFEQGVRYVYRLAAMDSARNMSETLERTLQIPKLRPPAPPERVRAVDDRGFRAVVQWNGSPDGDVTFYAIYRQADGAGELERLGRLPAHVRFFRDEQVKAGERLVYLVASVDSLGNEGAAAASDLVTIAPANPPRAPRNARATASPAGVALTWEPVPGDVAGYRVLRSTTVAGRYQPAHAGLLAETAWTDPAGAAGMWYRIIAVDAGGSESRPGEAMQAAAPRRNGGT